MSNDDRPLIAHVIYRLATGGLENGLVNLLNNLPKDRFRHVVICVTDSTQFAQRITNDDVRIFELHKRPGTDLLYYYRFWRLLRRLKPSIVHTRNLGTLDLAPVAALAGVPIRVHGEHGWNADDAFGQNRKHGFLRRVCDLAIRRYVAVSSNIEAWLCEDIGIRATKVRQIYNGVDTDRFRPLKNERLTGNITIGTVARLDPIKGIDILLKAFGDVLDRKPELRNRLRLSVVGDGPMFSALDHIIRRDDLGQSVELQGMRDDIPEVLRGIDIFVLASMNEGISNTILEAMASALPIVATRVGGNSELIVDGVTGKLVPAGVPDELADCIEAYVEDVETRRAHGAAARDRALESFSLDNMVARYAEFYESELNI